MKKLIIPLFLLAMNAQLFAQTGKAIFLHHSTGNAVYTQGNVKKWITNFNAQNNTTFSITEFSYPDTPWPWSNYPYDYWKLWIDGSCDNTQDKIQCLDKLCQDYELVIFKHCFPGAHILRDTDNGNVTSSKKTLNNYKLQYWALLRLLDQHPANKFLVWTLAPLHRNATDAGEAQRAAEFVDWVKNSWLKEDGKSHPNVFIFDFFSLAAELNKNPDSGMQYCLKYAYEGDHEGTDSHPNLVANQTIGPLFAAEITHVLGTNIIDAVNHQTSNVLQLQTDRANQTIWYHTDMPESARGYSIEVFSILGEMIYKNEKMPSSGMMKIDAKSGVYIFRIKNGNSALSRKIIL